jgi:hypothetical protein
VPPDLALTSTGVTQKLSPSPLRWGFTANTLDFWPMRSNGDRLNQHNSRTRPIMVPIKRSM